MAKVAGVSPNAGLHEQRRADLGRVRSPSAPLEALIVFFIAVVALHQRALRAQDGPGGVHRHDPRPAGDRRACTRSSGFQITPDTVIALLTILGYSLYDTVVVFDRVRDNAGTVSKSGDMSYAEMVNLSMNQTLARSINTSLVAILPVFSVLIVGAYILGATTLQNYGLALVRRPAVSGAYSSIFIASPLLSMFKEREPRFRELAERVGARAERRALTPAAAALLTGGGVQRTVRARAPGNATGVATSPAPSQAARAQAETALTHR